MWRDFVVKKEEKGAKVPSVSLSARSEQITQSRLTLTRTGWDWITAVLVPWIVLLV